MPATCEVSVVIAAFNREALIERALRSVWSQTLTPAEVIVVDDCSSDDTASVARAAGAHVLRHRQNRGPAAARNTAIEAATQPWIAVLDSDDEWLPHHLATLWPLRDGHDLVAGSAIYSSSPEFPSRLAGWPRRRALLLQSPAQLLYPENPIPSTVLLNREAVRRAGGYDEQVWFVEDIDLYARVLEGGSGLVAPIVTCVYRHHSGQATADLGYMHAQRRMLVERFAKRRWAKPAVLSRMQAVTEWDALRLAIRQRSRSDGLRAGAWLAGHPAASLALVGLWSWRFQARRGGREQAALLRAGDRAQPAARDM